MISMYLSARTIGWSAPSSFALNFTAHQHLAGLDLLLRVLLWRSEGETQALEQAHRAEISALEHSRQAAHSIVLGKLGNHGLDGLAREAATPVGAGQLVGDSCMAVGAHRCLNITDKLGSWNADGPIKPLFLTVGRQPRLELRKPRAQPFERRRRLVFELVDRRVTEDREHLLRVRRGLRLEREAGRLDDVHTRSTNERDFP